MISFKGIAPTKSTIVNTTWIGSFEISGVVEACRSETVGVYESPLIDQKWQIQLSFDDPSYVRLTFFSKLCPNEPLDKNGERKGQFEVSISMTEGFINQSHMEPFRRYQPTTNAFPANGWSHDYWTSKPSFLDFIHSGNVASLVYNITERLDQVPPPNNVLASFSDISASLFDDEETSNVVFAISDPRRSTRHDEYIYAHTKILAIRSEYFKNMFSSPFKDILSVTSVHELDLGVKDFSDATESELEDEDLTDGTLTPDDSLKDVTSTLKRRVVRITDASYATFRAMIYFLYTGLYYFTPLTSTTHHNRSSNSSDFSPDAISFQVDYTNLIESEQVSSPTSFNNGDVPRSNAKSIYKLCDRLDIPDLKSAALEHIRCSLTPDNITTELCSVFTSRFPEVREIEIEYLKWHWKDVKFSRSFGKLICKSFGDQPDGVAELWLEFFKQL